MFSSNGIHDKWIDDCIRYLKKIYGNTVSGQVVVDYGFGRGNWTLAFQRLGAKKVISVEASQTAVDRLTSYVRDNNIHNVVAVLGNTDSSQLNLSCDIVFLYGILHHVRYPEKLLKQAVSWLRNKNGSVLVYAYDSGCLRDIIVSRCRVMTKHRLDNWPGWQSTLHPLARHRASDDLVAPIVSFWSPEQLSTLLTDSGLKCVAQANDFSNFQGKSLKPEFDPYVLLAAPTASDGSEIAIIPNQHFVGTEYAAIVEALDVITIADETLNKVAIALGIFNTVFAISSADKPENRLFYTWCYIVNLFISYPTLLRAEALRPVTRDLMHITIERLSIDFVDSEMRHVLDTYPILSKKALNTSYRL